MNTMRIISLVFWSITCGVLAAVASVPGGPAPKDAQEAFERSDATFRADSYMNRVFPFDKAGEDIKLLEGRGIRGVDVTQSPFSKWQACQADAECTVVEAECPGWKPVNRAFEKDMEAHMAYKRPMVDCATAEMPPRPRVACVNGMCRETPESGVRP